MSNTTYLPASADSLARLHTAEAVGALVDVMRNGKNAERIRAAELIIDRGHGRAVQAVISVPAKHAIAARLAALDDAALLAIASAGRQRGSTGENEGPNAGNASAGPIQPTADCFPETALLPSGIRASQIEDGEFEDIDPCS